jgi:formiminotetrahydrofolate cyclodeaminase
MEAFRLKRKTNEEKKIRRDAIQSATKNAILVPLKVMKEAREIIKLTRQCAEKANVNAISDIGVSALCARSAASGAKLNVLINLKTIEDEEWKNKIKKEAAKIEKEVITISEEINEVVKEKMRP